jgi:hypothetical protein
MPPSNDIRPNLPFFKGFHLTLASHLKGRDTEGWKMADRSWVTFIHSQMEKGRMSEGEGRAALNPPAYDPKKVPLHIKGVGRLKADVVALLDLFASVKPPLVMVRALCVYHILYGFGDASGKGFGSTMLSSRGTRFRIGTWDSDSEEEFSNFREFENIVETLEAEDDAGNLTGALVYIFTDNSTVEAAVYKGNSSSQKLFEMVLRLKKLEMKNGATFLVTHVSGKRMMAQDTDGVSRGQFKEGVTAGQAMLSFVPLSKSALEVHPPLQAWIASWAGGKGTEFLTPEGWFERGHDIIDYTFRPFRKADKDSEGFWIPKIKSGTFVWAPPPGAAEAALEELRKARIKRQDSLHIFVCPRLMTTRWFRQMNKAADLIFEIPAGCPYWPTQMYEPLTIGLVFPFIRSAPWQLRRTPKMFAMGRKMRRVLEEDPLAAGNILREFLLECRRLSTMQEDMVRGMLFFEPQSEVPCEARGPRSGRKRRQSSGQGAAGPSLGQEGPSGERLPPCKKRRPHDGPV